MIDVEEVCRDLQTIRDFLRWSLSCFSSAELYYGHGQDNGWDEAVQLVTHYLRLPADIDNRVLDARLTRTEKAGIFNLVQQRVEGREPLAYLTGEAWFMGMPFFVDRRVLVPRSPIAELLAQGLQPWLGSRPVTQVLDLCTGSGCIGIAAATVFPQARVDLVDISVDALAVAERNIARHQLEHRVTTVPSDLFQALPGRRYDVVLSNPPYVGQAEYAALPAEYYHEPELGLIAQDDGLAIVRRILREAASFLSDDGLLIVEVGNTEKALCEAYPSVPFIWPEFEQGGHGVFILGVDDLRECQAQFDADF